MSQETDEFIAAGPLWRVQARENTYMQQCLPKRHRPVAAQLSEKACGKGHIVVLGVRYISIPGEDEADNQKVEGVRFDASFPQTSQTSVFPVIVEARNVSSRGENLFQALLRRPSQTSRRG
jgi:hypothetical protein